MKRVLLLVGIWFVALSALVIAQEKSSEPAPERKLPEGFYSDLVRRSPVVVLGNIYNFRQEENSKICAVSIGVEEVWRGDVPEATKGDGIINALAFFSLKKGADAVLFLEATPDPKTKMVTYVATDALAIEGGNTDTVKKELKAWAEFTKQEAFKVLPGYRELLLKHLFGGEKLLSHLAAKELLFLNGKFSGEEISRIGGLLNSSLSDEFMLVKLGSALVRNGTAEAVPHLIDALGANASGELARLCRNFKLRSALGSALARRFESIAYCAFGVQVAGAPRVEMTEQAQKNLITALGYVGGTDEGRMLLRMMRQGGVKPGVMPALLETLGSLQMTDAKEDLVQYAAETRTAAERAAAVNGLSNMKAPEGIDVMRSMISSKAAPEVQLALVEALGRYDAKMYQPLLQSLFSTLNDKPALEKALELFGGREKDAEYATALLTRDVDVWVRVDVVELCIKYKFKNTGDAMIDILRNRENHIKLRFAAYDALKKFNLGKEAREEFYREYYEKYIDRNKKDNGK